MSNINKFKIDLFSILNSSANYAVLRDFNELPLSQLSHDIDLIIDKKDYLKKNMLQNVEAIEKMVFLKIQKLDIKIYLKTWICGLECLIFTKMERL